MQCHEIHLEYPMGETAGAVVNAAIQTDRFQ